MQPTGPNAQFSTPSNPEKTFSITGPAEQIPTAPPTKVQSGFQAATDTQFANTFTSGLETTPPPPVPIAAQTYPSPDTSNVTPPLAYADGFRPNFQPPIPNTAQNPEPGSYIGQAQLVTPVPDSSPIPPQFATPTQEATPIPAAPFMPGATPLSNPDQSNYPDINTLTQTAPIGSPIPGTFAAMTPDTAVLPPSPGQIIKDGISPAPIDYSQNNPVAAPDNSSPDPLGHLMDQVAVAKGIELPPPAIPPVPNLPLNFGPKGLSPQATENAIPSPTESLSPEKQPTFDAFKNSLINVFKGLNDSAKVMQIVNEALVHGSAAGGRIDPTLEPVYIGAFEEFMKWKSQNP